MSIVFIEDAVYAAFRSGTMGRRPISSVGNPRKCPLAADRGGKERTDGNHLGQNRMAKHRWLGALATLLLWAGCVAPPRETAPVAWHRTTLGLCEDYREETRRLAKAKSDLAAARAAGAQVLRIAFAWDTMEPERGRYDWTFWDDFVRSATRDYGLRLIPYICYTPKWAASDPGPDYWRSPPRDPEDFARFVTAIVDHYRDEIQSWELWNEPDNRAYWLGTPQQFAALIRAGSAAVRRTDPGDTVVLGGMVGDLDFLTKLLRDERLGTAVDIVNVTSYFETWHPARIESIPSYVERVADLVRDTGGHHPLWMAETGYSSIGTRADGSSVYRSRYEGEHSDAAQAAALVRTVMTTCTTEAVATLAWYRINDLVPPQNAIGDDNNRHLGLRRADGTAKPALAAFHLMAELFRQPYVRVPVSVRVEGAGESVPVVWAFRLQDGRRIVAAWLALPEVMTTGSPVADPRQAVVAIAIPELRPRRARFLDAEGRPVAEAGNRWQRTGTGTTVTLALRGGAVRIVDLSQ